MKAAQSAQAERDRGQMSLFGASRRKYRTMTVTLTDAPKFDPLERLKTGKRTTRFLCFWTPA